MNIKEFSEKLQYFITEFERHKQIFRMSSGKFFSYYLDIPVDLIEELLDTLKSARSEFNLLSEQTTKALSISDQESKMATQNRQLELTQEELDFIDARCYSKAVRLEESGLDDTPCYQIAWQILKKIKEVKDQEVNKK